MFHVKAGVKKEQLQVSWRSCPAWALLWCLPYPSLVAGVGALQNYLRGRECHVIVTPNLPGSLYFSRHLVELEIQ